MFSLNYLRGNTFPLLFPSNFSPLSSRLFMIMDTWTFFKQGTNFDYLHDTQLHNFSHVLMLIALFLAFHQGEWGHHSCVCHHRPWHFSIIPFQSKCLMFMALNNSLFITVQLYIPPPPSPHRRVLVLHVGQLLLVDSRLLPQRQTLCCHSIDFLQRKSN